MQERFPAPEFDSPTGGAFPPPASRRVYCNRSLRLDQIGIVGFDMDYTLAVYRQAEMDRLSIEVTISKLVERGYPQALLSMEYRTDFPVRGLLIDRKLGNVLKMDRYRYVKTAYHGFRRLTREERRRAYHTRRLRPGTERYHWVDTLYGLSEVAVYAAVIAHLERHGTSVDYAKLFADVRECADISHQDGSILDVVQADLPKFVDRDPGLGTLFHKLRSAGKRLFVLTNSGPDYTEAMMSYLLDDALGEYPSWRNYFDYIMTASKKPSFFTQKTPFTDVATGQETERPSRGRMYTGGNIADLRKTLGVPGDEVLYVGDHIYGDVLRAKKESAWRTAMIIQEMDDELRTLQEHAAGFERAAILDQNRTAVQDELREHQARLKKTERALQSEDNLPGRPALEAERVRRRRSIDRLRAQLRDLDAEATSLNNSLDEAFHPFWGSSFKAGTEVSSFGNQIEQYACLYTSRASNLAQYSPMHYFQSPRHRMPHEVGPSSGL
ncbi:MAG: HAD-IG family 5'-nucleotidase [Myxococcota bacterium]